MLVIKHIDPWGEELRFDLKKDHGIVRSAGCSRLASAALGDCGLQPILLRADELSTSVGG